MKDESSGWTSFYPYDENSPLIDCEAFIVSLAEAKHSGEGEDGVAAIVAAHQLRTDVERAVQEKTLTPRRGDGLVMQGGLRPRAALDPFDGLYFERDAFVAFARARWLVKLNAEPLTDRTALPPKDSQPNKLTKPISKAPPPIKPLKGNSLSLVAGYKFDKPNWARWQMMDRLRLWEAACLVADIEPPRPGGDGIWAEYQLKEFPAAFHDVWEVMNRDELLTRLPLQPCSGRMLHTTSLGWFAQWAVRKGLPVPEPLRAIGYQAEYRAEWWNLGLHAVHWWREGSVTAQEAAALLYGVDPYEKSTDPALVAWPDEKGLSEYAVILRTLEGVERVEPQHRALAQWLQIARARGLNVHSWINEWLGMQPPEIPDGPSADASQPSANTGSYDDRMEPLSEGPEGRSLDIERARDILRRQFSRADLIAWALGILADPASDPEDIRRRQASVHEWLLSLGLRFRTAYGAPSHLPRDVPASPPPGMPASGVDPRELQYLKVERVRVAAMAAGFWPATALALNSATTAPAEATPSNAAPEEASNEQESTRVGLSTPDMASAFADIGGWTEHQWKRNLGNSGGKDGARWLLEARMTPGRQGKAPAFWDPVRLARLAMDTRSANKALLKKAFRENPLLKEWEDDWKRFLSDDEYYGGK